MKQLTIYKNIVFSKSFYGAELLFYNEDNEIN